LCLGESEFGPKHLQNTSKTPSHTLHAGSTHRQVRRSGNFPKKVFLLVFGGVLGAINEPNQLKPDN